MIYSDFVAQVVEELGVDGNRRGIETQRARWIRDAVVDLQRFIRAYRQGHTTNYEATDLVEKGYAHLGTLPDQAKPKAFYIVSTGETVEEGVTDNPNIVRNRLDYVAWQDRQPMIDGRYDRRMYQYAISPFSKQFMVHPLVNDETYLLLVWDGMKTDFDDADTVPWPSWAAEAVAAYVKWKILKYVDKRLDLAGIEWQSYVNARLKLWREQNEAQVADGRDEEYMAGSVPAQDPGATQFGSSLLTIGDVSKAITFPNAFADTPIVDCWIVMPDSSAFNISCNPDGSTISTTGFTALLSAAIPAGSYTLMWSASLPTS